MNIKDFAGTSPEFLPEAFFDGGLEGWGIVERLTGNLQRRFTVKANGTWNKTQRLLDFSETWTFEDGWSDTLTWRISKLDHGVYEGTERRIDGRAEGEQAGCAFHWRYTRDTPMGDGKSMVLNFNDWFYRIDERVGMVRGSAGRAGIPFSIVHATYRKLQLG